jgi:hypothetical protein
MIERVVYANTDNDAFPIKVGDGPDGLADPKDSVCVEMDASCMYIDKAQWYELVRAVDQWFADAPKEE